MKKMAYLMMLVLGLSAVQTTNASMGDRIMKKINSVKANTKEFITAMGNAKTASEKLKVMEDHGKAAIDRNIDQYNELKKASLEKVDIAKVP